MLFLLEFWSSSLTRRDILLLGSERSFVNVSTNLMLPWPSYHHFNFSRASKSVLSFAMKLYMSSALNFFIFCLRCWIDISSPGEVFLSSLLSKLSSIFIPVSKPVVSKIRPRPYGVKISDEVDAYIIFNFMSCGASQFYLKCRN